MWKGARNAIIVLVAVLVAGCNGSDDGFSGTGPGGGAPPPDGGDGGDAVVGSLVVGSGAGSGFQPGALAIGVSPVSTGGSTGISGRLLTADGDPAQGIFEVRFSSDCVADGKAEIISPRTVINGQFNTTYTAAGCAGEDMVVATIEVDAGTLAATGTVQIAPAALGSIVFVSAEPELIGLKGMGGAGVSETSAVVFEVRDVFGQPVASRPVSFSLSTAVGGITLSDGAAASNQLGQVTVVVNSGTVATPVRVNAVVDDTNIASQSSLISVSTGIPEQLGFSLSATTWNIGAMGCDGETVPLTVRARDRFTNPVQDGTVIHFSSRAGNVEASCQTQGGACTVNWTSQAPYYSRSAILAYAIGEESFIDHTGDGLFGPEEAAATDWQDIGEPFRDDTETGGFIAGLDGFFWDFDVSGDWTGPNGVFDGPLCGAGIEDDAARQDFRDQFCGMPQAPVGAMNVLVISENADPRIDFPHVVGGTHSIGGDGPLVVRVSDPHDQPPPSGSVVAVVSMEYGEVDGTDSITLPGINMDGPVDLVFPLTDRDEDVPGCGVAIVEITTPGNSCNGGATRRAAVQICN